MSNYKNTFILKDRTLMLDANEYSRLVSELINYGKSDTYGLSLKDFVGKDENKCELTNEKGAIKMISCFSDKTNKVGDYILKPSIMLRLISKTLMPSEWKKLFSNHKHEFHLHDGFYDYNNGISVQPLTYRYFDKNEYKNFDSKELKQAIKEEMNSNCYEKGIHFGTQKKPAFQVVKEMEMVIQETIRRTFNDNKGWWEHLSNPHYNMCLELLQGKPYEDVVNEVVGNMKLKSGKPPKDDLVK